MLGTADSCTGHLQTCTHKRFISQLYKLENVVIANALQLKAALRQSNVAL